MRLPSLFAYLALISVTSASAAWLRLPNLDRKPVGMELAFAGTTIHSASGMVDAAVLTMGDPLKSAKLGAGRSETTIKFTRQSLVQKLSFVSDGLAG